MRSAWNRLAGATYNLPSLGRFGRGLAAGCLLAAALPLTTGCSSWFISKRKLPVPLAPAKVQTASADELVSQLNERWSKFESMTATVDIVASHLKAKEGEATDYPSFHANLLLSKPEKIRVLGRVPVVQTTMFDLASDGTRFVLVVPPKKKAFEGLNASKGTSLNWYENLRPGPLFSAMVVPGLRPDELYSVTAETITEEDTANKRLLVHPEYVLNIVRRKPDSQELYPVRVVHFHREDLLPYEQDLYDDKGDLETQVIFGPYRNFDGAEYPGKVTMKRPQEEYQLVMTVDQMVANPQLKDDQFQTKIPEGVVPVQMK